METKIRLSGQQTNQAKKSTWCARMTVDVLAFLSAFSMGNAAAADWIGSWTTSPQPT
jgi:hypothetical protein